MNETKTDAIDLDAQFRRYAMRKGWHVTDDNGLLQRSAVIQQQLEREHTTGQAEGAAEMKARVLAVLEKRRDVARANLESVRNMSLRTSDALVIRCAAQLDEADMAVHNVEAL